MSQLRENNAELRADNAELRGRNARLEKSLKRHGILEDEDGIEVEEATVTLSVAHQNVIEADESNDITPPSTDEAASSQRAGFGKNSRKKNSLDRKTDPQPEPRTSGDATEDTTIGV
jgi:hypothetical protein